MPLQIEINVSSLIDFPENRCPSLPGRIAKEAHPEADRPSGNGPNRRALVWFWDGTEFILERTVVEIGTQAVRSLRIWPSCHLIGTAITHVPILVAIASKRSLVDARVDTLDIFRCCLHFQRGENAIRIETRPGRFTY